MPVPALFHKGGAWKRAYPAICLSHLEKRMTVGARPAACLSDVTSRRWVQGNKPGSAAGRAR